MTIERVGVLTFHRSLNHGSVLQAWALTRVLARMGLAVEIIDYVPPAQERVYSMFDKRWSPRAMAKNARSLVFYPLLARRKRGFERFVETRLPVSAARYGSEVDFARIGDVYDAIVSGGDQIWNPRAGDFTEVYLQPFGNGVRKVAYGPSVNDGDLDATDRADWRRELLEDFYALSVREASGKEKLERLLGGPRDIAVVADPTLLLEPDEYDLLGPARTPARPYIFLYTLNYAPSVLEAAAALHGETGLPVRTVFTGPGTYSLMARRISARGAESGTTRHRVTVSRRGSPVDFLALLRGADHVVTNSYHGTALSVLFRKRFHAVYRTRVDGSTWVDARIDNLLGTVGLADRVVHPGQTLDIRGARDIDYSAVDTLRREFAGASLEFLREALS